MIFCVIVLGVPSLSLPSLSQLAKYHHLQKVAGAVLPKPCCIPCSIGPKSNHNIEFSLLDQIMLWKRFIDDIFMLFKGSKHECESLVNWLNSLYPGVIKFKYEYSMDMVEFLDLQIILENGKIETNLYIKPSALLILFV